MTGMEEVLAECSDWTDLRTLESRLGTPLGHRAHINLRSLCKSYVQTGRMESRRLDGRDAEYRTVPGYRPSASSAPIQFRVLRAIEGEMTTRQIADRTGFAPGRAYHTLARLERRGLVSKRLAPTTALWTRTDQEPERKPLSIEDGKMEEGRKEQPKPSKEAEDCEMDTRNEP